MSATATAYRTNDLTSRGCLIRDPEYLLQLHDTLGAGEEYGTFSIRNFADARELLGWLAMRDREVSIGAQDAYMRDYRPSVAITRRANGRTVTLYHDDGPTRVLVLLQSLFAD